MASLPRLEGRLDYKRDNNRAMLMAKNDAAALMPQVLRQFPCIASANFDVLIPWAEDQKEFIPMRTALGKKNAGNYVLPDLLVLNTHLPSGAASPLQQLVIQDEMHLYRPLGHTDLVSVYVKRNLECTARTELK